MSIQARKNIRRYRNKIMKGRCVATYKRTVWVGLERYYKFPTTTMKYFETEKEAKEFGNIIGSLTISSDSDIHIMEIDEK